MNPERYLDLAVEAPLANALTYKTNETIGRGESVWVPLGKRRARAVVLREGKPREGIQIKDIGEADAARPKLPEKFLNWLEWIAEYYIYPVGQVTSLAFPPLDKRESNRKSKKSPVIPDVAPDKAPTLTDEQVACLTAIKKHSGFQTHLLHGVTGSGKTEVYLNLLTDTLASGKRGLMLVPEISLTPQLIGRFARRFGDQIAVLHSQLTDRERTNQWWSIVSGEKKILIGARSALFCPIPDLGLIIVDEEHEPSYKQEEKLRYHARDAAIVLAKTLDIPVLLGSATPSLESWRNAQAGRYHLHQMFSRVGERRLPQVTVVDLRELKKERKDPTGSQKVDTDLPFWMSPAMHDGILSALRRREQSALFLNRRGVAPTVLCAGCGFVYKCPNCAISLTLHGQNHLVCHYCDYSHKVDPMCPSCKQFEPHSVGLGTEQIENDIRQMFPDARVARADRDEIQSREAMEELVEQMEAGEIDVLVGTQMIAKGLDFPRLTFVGLVLADLSFNLPDFRSTERSFQLLTQVSGRSGRHVQDGGQVIVQTYQPEHSSVVHAMHADYKAFAAQELAMREELGYPPYGRLAAVRISGIDARKAEATAQRFAERAMKLKELHANYNEIQVLGPVEAPLFKLRGKFRYHLLLKTPKQQILSAFIKQVLGDSDWVPSATKVQVDIDPLNLM